MSQNNYEGILASLNVDLNSIKHVKIIPSSDSQAVEIPDYKNVSNRLVRLNKGKISWKQGSEVITLKEGDMFFLPELSSIPMTYGSGDTKVVDNNQFANQQNKYLEVVSSLESISESFSYVSFDAKVYEAIDLFKFINIPAFQIENNARLQTIFQNIITEEEQDRLAKDTVLHNLSNCLVIELMRHIIEKSLFIEKLVDKADSFKNKRLAILFKYIADNIPNDLSNTVLARVVGLSKDYIGQYFKNLTSMGLQNYIETIRLNKAMHLLKNNPSMKIGDVSSATGFSDLAYFCRKFKQQWGTTARKMRARARQSA